MWKGSARRETRVRTRHADMAEEESPDREDTN